ncbi:MAG: ATP-binding cassette domain-containing protein [Clostridium sp.]|jgi:ABC-type lipoprotein export system ATPase subunit|uniref:ATP-binding cassette domain-containing protein n=1 Tax=Clostridium sp. TaxID=1506 RepID=UPI0025C04184|nr:ATP-binding cassette domain-containing protein [Clostridium sp.]MCH3964757.1 ATP-binding cassette domain-containing protein [Clostridium sp.]MCI1715228.1 ATP-binding cassette domain-containing protein [Clostridium sp.]MCI1799490.1 ATP-binding cassette domain-containing protein [Clostridium sp.]MCI1813411.1 ATP-binding cassette domain-containing protein [Clostridium sp.]MCI1870302.1 ATP-binding cassette domain-containing protein [Clostridium sp.]
MKDLIDKNYIIDVKIEDLLGEYPNIKDFFTSIGVDNIDISMTAREISEGLNEIYLENMGYSRSQILYYFTDFVQKMNEIKYMNNFNIRSLTVIGGHDKSGKREELELTFECGQVVCIVGRTGSGKSRLLEDIECLAQRDTPTGRQILVNGKVPEEKDRFCMDNKIVAQLSQNMNFIMDVTVEEFIKMHAESRMIYNAGETVESIIECANDLAGEKFSKDAAVTQLSGGQSRALMIADTALLSRSPIILIDEIENAGIDRKKAIETLLKKDKIIFMSTHDPILALMGNTRIVIKNGGIYKVIKIGKDEKKNLVPLEYIDNKLLEIRNRLRDGEIIDFDIGKYFKYKN